MLTQPFYNLGLTEQELNQPGISLTTPIDGSHLGKVAYTPAAKIKTIIERAQQAFLDWREVPAPKRGEVIRCFANRLREHKQDLGMAVSIETGKILQEGLGEVQEMIDMCDFAVGLARQLYGLTMPSERFEHRLMETWHPLGVVGVISAFNFPVAVWAWNFALAIVCGNAVVWKPARKTPLCALVCQKLFAQAIAECAIEVPPYLSQVIICDSAARELFVDHPLVRLISATGSTAMGKKVAPRVAARLGRSLLELGGNNGMIVTPSADLTMAIQAIVFSAVGTAGQRCTSLRRLFVHESIYEQVLHALKQAYAQLVIGDPLQPKTHVGPMVSQSAYQNMQVTLQNVITEGGKVWGGERALVNQYPQAYYVNPALIEMPGQSSSVGKETFAPILYIMKYKEFAQAIALHNDVSQGLSSSIFTQDMREAEQFISCRGSDCGLANVNVGPSGAEIGGAFGGEKDTGGGRESGSDAWKNYMRRATNTINYSTTLPLAQGIKFGDF